MIWDGRLTDAVAAEICRRSAAGEGVLAIIKEMQLPDETLDWLKACHRGAVVAAKKVQITNKVRG